MVVRNGSGCARMFVYEQGWLRLNDNEPEDVCQVEDEVGWLEGCL